MTRAGAGPTLKNEPAEVRGSGTGWREDNSALCSAFIRTQGIARCTRYTATLGAQLPPMLCSLHGEGIIFIWGPNFEMLLPPHRTLGGTHRGRPNSQKGTR